MSNPVIQTSFNSGEWAPALNARVDLAKYHSGAALLRNFFVDYRGGATTRPGTRYVLQTRLTSTARLIPFQASFTVTYILEFGQGYVRFFNNAAPVLEAATTITAATAGTPEVFTDTAHGYIIGDWLVIGGNTYIVTNFLTNTSPYQASELAGLKFVQNVNQMYICHPNYPPYVLTLNSVTNWTLAPINFS